MKRYSACIASIIRLHALYVVSVSDDITWDNPGTAIWSSIELNVAIICTSISVLKPLLSRIIPGLLSGVRSKAKSGGTGGTGGTMVSFSDGRKSSAVKPRKESESGLEMMEESEREVWGLREVRASVLSCERRDGEGKAEVEIAEAV